MGHIHYVNEGDSFGHFDHVFLVVVPEQVV